MSVSIAEVVKAARRLYDATGDASMAIATVHHDRCISSDNCTCLAEAVELDAAREAFAALYECGET